MTFAIYSFVNIIGIYEYATYSKKLFINAKMENSVYFMISRNSDMGGGPEAMRYINKIMEDIKNTPGVESLFSDDCIQAGFKKITNGQYGIVNIALYTNDMINRFKFKIKSGKWLDDTSSDSSIIECVIGGIAAWEGINVGDIIEVDVSNKNQKNLKLKVIGILSEPCYAHSYGNGGSYINTGSFLDFRDNHIIVRETTELIQMTKETDAFISSSFNFFVNFDNNITESQKIYVLDLLVKYGSYSDYDEITKNTDDKILYELKTKLPFPLFSFIISFSALISTSILLVYKKVYDFSVYTLCGCNKAKCIAFMAISLGIPGIIAGGFNMLNIIIDPYYFRNIDSYINADNCMITNNFILPIMLITILTISISIFIPMFNYYKYPPIEIYRRIKQ
jgi:hypothetical protein